jgi:beta-1,4-mannosyl-glycoprotein beta-1,4-N-acetylglucosaminyltransferase
MIYDCFTFFNELDLLEIRLHVLNDVVDKFVLVEATKAHSGKEKPLYFNENKARFKAFENKIIHIIVDEYPVCTSPWAYENHQRNAVLRGLTQAKPDDIVMISDLDEIPSPEMVRAHADSKEIILFVQKLYYYFLNYLNVSSPEWPLGTKLLPYAFFLGEDKALKFTFSEFLLPELNQGVTPTKIRFVENVKVIRNAGWHFSYLGGTEAIIKKIQSTAHQEFNSAKNTDPKEILEQISSGKDIFGRGDRFFGVPIDVDYPRYIRDNQEKFPHLIFSVTPDYMWQTWQSRRYYSYRGELYRFIVFRVIPRSLHPLLIRIRNLLWFGQTAVPRPDVETTPSKKPL